jgi:hypothetical protein
MTYEPQISRGVEDGGRVIRAPRRTDAIGASLCRVYGRPSTMPRDFAALLDQLDDAPHRAH